MCRDHTSAINAQTVLQDWASQLPQLSYETTMFDMGMEMLCLRTGLQTFLRIFQKSNIH